MAKEKKKVEPKPRNETYEPKLAIKGSFAEVLKVILTKKI